MARYIVSMLNVTPTGGNDVMTLIAASSGRLRVLEVAVGGLGTSAAAQAFNLSRSSSGSTPASALTPTKVGASAEISMLGSAYSAWTGQPYLSTNSRPLVFNALGGANVWTVPAGAFEMVSTSEYFSIRASTAVTWQACSVSAIVEENW